jgi:hypothetical protein
MPLFTPTDLYTPNNLPRTRSLICEFEKDGPITINRFGREGKINLYELFVSLTVDDPTEVSFAEEVFGDVLYWKALSEDKLFAPKLDEWRYAVAEKRKKLAFKTIVEEAKGGGKSSFTAAKYLIEEPWLTGNTASEKKAVAKAKEASSSKAYHATEFAKDLERLKEEGLYN